MKRTKIFFIFAVLFVAISIVIPLKDNKTIFAYAQTINLENETKQPNKNEIDNTIDEIIDKTNLDEFENFFKELNLFEEKYTIKELVLGILNNDFHIDFNFLLSYIFRIFFGNIKGLLIQAIIILIVTVLMSILNNLTSDFSKGSTKKLVHLACYGVIIATTCLMISDSIVSVGKTIRNIDKFCQIVFPVLLTFVSAIGANASIAVYQPLVLVFATLVLKIINYIIIPAFIISIVFHIIGNLSDELKLGKIADTAKSIGEWIVGISFGLFITYTTTKGITGASIDSLATKGAKYALGSYVPIIGGYLKDGFDLVTASCIVIKNAFGFVSVIILLIMLAIPTLKLVGTTLILKLTAAIAEPIGEKKVSDMLHGVSKSFTLPIVACISAFFSLFIIIMLIILTCNRGVI